MNMNHFFTLKLEANLKRDLDWSGPLSDLIAWRFCQIGSLYLCPFVHTIRYLRYPFYESCA